MKTLLTAAYTAQELIKFPGMILSVENTADAFLLRHKRGNLGQADRFINIPFNCYTPCVIVKITNVTDDLTRTELYIFSDIKSRLSSR